MYEVIIAEYSLAQQSFHVQPLSYAVKVNKEGVLRGHATDYLPIGVFENYEDANRFCGAFRRILEGNEWGEKAR